MGVRFSILASGSTGNSMIVESQENRILIDAGLSMKKIEQLLQERQTQLNAIDAVFITHEHSDHIKGLGALARKHRLPVYANSRTWAELDKLIGDIAEEQVRVMETGERIQVGTLTVESFAISHDAAEPVGYCFYEKDLKISLATDLGYMSPKVKEKIADSDALILEANHDVEMLRIGHYPWNIKRRILSDTGHLSNEAAGEALCELITSRTRGVYLAHLSRDHNLLDLAKLTVQHILQENGILNKYRQIQLMDTYFDRPTKWEVVGDV